MKKKITLLLSVKDSIAALANLLVQILDRICIP